MARSTFGGTNADGVFSTYTLGAKQLLALSTATLTFWDAETDGTQYTDLLLNGAAVSSISCPLGQVPAFEGPDSVTEMWADDGDGTRSLMVAQGRQGPAGPEGPAGAPGGSDASFAGWINDTASQTHGALSASIVPNRVTDYGAAKDDATDDAPAIQSLIDTVRDTVRAAGLNANNVVRIPAGIYEIGSTITVPPYVKLLLEGTVILRYTGAGTAVHVTPLADDPVELYAGLTKMQWANTPMLPSGGLIILGPGYSGTGHAGTGLAVGSTTDLGSNRAMARYHMGDISMSGFSVGIALHLNNHYLGTYDNLHLENNTVGLEVGSGTNTNSGENFRFNNCIFAGANEGIGIRSPAWDATFNACSFDYLDRVFTIEGTGYGSLTLVGGHIEAITAESDTPAYGAKTGGVAVADSTVEVQQIAFTNTTILTDAKDPLIRGPVVVTGTVALRPTGTPVEAAGFFATDTDLVSGELFQNVYSIVRLPTTREHNLIPDPTFKLAAAGVVSPGGPLAGWASLDWPVGVTVEVVDGAGWEGGKALRLTMNSGTYFAMTAAADLPLRTLRDQFAGLILKPSAPGVQTSCYATYKRPDGTTASTPDVSLASNGLAAGDWRAVPSLAMVNVGYAVPLRAMASVKPTFIVSQNTGAALSVDIGLVYFGQ